MEDVIDGLTQKIGKIPVHAVCGKRPSFVSPAEKTEKWSNACQTDSSNYMVKTDYGVQ